MGELDPVFLSYPPGVFQGVCRSTSAACVSCAHDKTKICGHRRFLINHSNFTSRRTFHHDTIRATRINLRKRKRGARARGRSGELVSRPSSTPHPTPRGREQLAARGTVFFSFFTPDWFFLFFFIPPIKKKYKYNSKWQQQRQRQQLCAAPRRRRLLAVAARYLAVSASRRRRTPPPSSSSPPPPPSSSRTGAPPPTERTSAPQPSAAITTHPRAGPLVASSSSRRSRRGPLWPGPPVHGTSIKPATSTAVATAATAAREVEEEAQGA